MNNMMLFLATQSQIKEVLLLLGVYSSEWLAVDICKNMHLEHLSIFVPTHTLRDKIDNALEELRYQDNSVLPEHLDFVSEEDLQSYVPDFPDFTLAFDDPASNEQVLGLAHLKPAMLVGVGCKDNINAFYIWQTYREFSRHIYIISWKHEEECLNWVHDPKSDIELSIIFPMYKVADYLPQCVESVTKWDAPYVEYLFVDDGSPDNCADIIRKYAKKDSRVKLLQKPNGGCASARQYGLERAKGRYIGFIDPDDFIDPTMYRKLLSRALTGSYEIAYCGYNEQYESDGSTREISDMLAWPYNEGTSDPNRINELIAYLRVAIWRGIYLRDMIDRNHIHFYTDLRRFDDLPFKVETLSKARSVVAVPEYLYYYRLARPGQDVSANDERLYVHFPIFKYLDEFLRRSTDRKQLDYLQIVKVHTHRYALEKIKPEFVKEYCRQAKEDIRSNYKFWEGAYILRRGAGRDDMKYYLALYFGWPALVKWMKRPQAQKKDANAAAIRKLKAISIANKTPDKR